MTFDSGLRTLDFEQRTSDYKYQMLDRTFGKYELIRRLGRGGMADVYLARDTEHRREVALKLVEMRADREGREIYDAERRGALLQEQFSRLDAHVPDVHGYGTCAEHFYIDMEYVDGEDLAERIARAPIAPEHALNIAAAIGSFLERAHAFEATIDDVRIRGIIHGDIKPKNIRINREGHVKILDFGIAKGLSLTRKLTHNDFGSLAYLSPERLDTGEVDVHSDLWSVGVLFYEMLAGVPPFDHRDAQKLEQIIRGRHAPPPLPADCPAGIVRIVLKMLAPSLVRRYASATAMLADLEAFRNGETTEADRHWLSDEAEAGATRRTFPAAESRQPEAVCPDVEAAGSPSAVGQHQYDAAAGIAAGVVAAGMLDVGLADALPTSQSDDTAAREHAERVARAERAERAGRADGLPPTAVLAVDEATRRTSAASPGDGTGAADDGTRRTVHADAEATRRTTASAGPLETPAVPDATAPDKPRGTRRRIAALLLGSAARWWWRAAAAAIILIVVGVGWNEAHVWSAARELRVGLATQQGSELGHIWDDYEKLSERSLLGIGLAGVRGPLKERLVASADHVIADYRQDAPSVREAQWRDAVTCLTNALHLDPGDRAVAASLQYCEGQVERITGEARKRKRLPADANLHEAVNRFQDAARLNPRWPDPYLGLARTYIYGLDDLDKGIAALDEAEHRGYRPGNRELVQMADGYRRRADHMLGQAAGLKGLPQEGECLQKAADDYHRALDLYAKAIGFGEAGTFIKQVQKQIDLITARQDQIAKNSAVNSLESGVKALLQKVLGPKNPS